VGHDAVPLRAVSIALKDHGPFTFNGQAFTTLPYSGRFETSRVYGFIVWVQGYVILYGRVLGQFRP
jgi:hypothetical protein